MEQETLKTLVNLLDILLNYEDRTGSSDYDNLTRLVHDKLIENIRNL